MIGLSVDEARVVLEGVDRLQSIDFVSQNQIQVACRIMDKFPELEREYSYLKDRYNQSLYKRVVDSEMLEDGNCGGVVEYLSGMSIREALNCSPTLHSGDLPDWDCQKLILKEAADCEAWGVNNNQVITLGWLGRVVLVVYGTDQAVVTYVPHRLAVHGDSPEWCFKCIQFLINKSELLELGKTLRQKLDYQAPFEAIHRGGYDAHPLRLLRESYKTVV